MKFDKKNKFLSARSHFLTIEICFEKKIAVFCKGENEYNTVGQRFAEKKVYYATNHDGTWEEDWDSMPHSGDYCDGICLSLHRYNYGTKHIVLQHCSKKYYIENGFKIISAEKFLQQSN